MATLGRSGEVEGFSRRKDVADLEQLYLVPPLNADNQRLCNHAQHLLSKSVFSV